MAEQVQVDVKSSITRTVVELFDTMLSLEVELVDEGMVTGLEGDRMIGSVSFAGDVLGSIHVQAKNDVAKIITAAMLGIDVEDIESEEDIKDVIREVCNILGGNMKTDFVNSGFNAVISTPSLTLGNDFQVETRNMSRYEHLEFKHGDHVLIVEICFKPTEDLDLESKLVLKSIDVEKFNRLDLVQTVGDKVIEMFDMMLGMKLEMADFDFPQHTDELHYMGAVDLAGDVNGRINIRISEILARIMTSKMFDMKLDDIEGDSELKDIIGEASNIIAGNLKAGFCDSGLNCVISTPSITSGHDFRIETINMDREERFGFRFLEHHIFVQVAVKIDEDTDFTAKPVSDSDEKASAIDAEQIANRQKVVQTSIDEFSEEEAEKALEKLKEETHKDSGALEINQANLELLLDIPIDITVELGRTKMTIDELLNLGPGSAVLLANLEGEPLDILANERLIAKGEVVVENEKYGIRITEVIDRLSRIKTLR